MVLASSGIAALMASLHGSVAVAARIASESRAAALPVGATKHRPRRLGPARLGLLEQEREELDHGRGLARPRPAGDDRQAPEQRERRRAPRGPEARVPPLGRAEGKRRAMPSRSRSASTGSRGAPARARRSSARRRSWR